MRMLPSSSLTDPDVQVSRFRFFMEEFRSRRCSDGRSGLPAEGDAVGVRRTGSWGTGPYDPAAPATSARSSRPDGRTSLGVVTGGVNPRIDGEACAGEDKGAVEAPGSFNGMAIQSDG